MTEAERSAFQAASNLLGLGDEHADHAHAVLVGNGGAACATVARWITQKRLGEARGKLAEALRTSECPR
jgi:shikimate 5-dehydrogenase